MGNGIFPGRNPLVLDHLGNGLFGKIGVTPDFFIPFGETRYGGLGGFLGISGTPYEIASVGSARRYVILMP